MISRLKKKLKKWQLLLREKIKHKNVQVYFLSYPKCGRTWLRFMIGKAISDQYNLNVSLNDITEVYQFTSRYKNIPTIEFSHDDFPQFSLPGKLISNKKKFKDKIVIFLVRDPKDVLVSYFNQYMYRGAKELLEKTNGKKENISDIHDFLYKGTGNLNNIVEYYNVWAKNRQLPKKFLLVRYEALKENTFEELKKIFETIGIKISDELLLKSIEYSSFANMRTLEQENKLNKGRFGKTNGSESSLKTRKGKVGSYKEIFNDKEKLYINENLAKLDKLYSFYK